MGEGEGGLATCVGVCDALWLVICTFLVYNLFCILTMGLLGEINKTKQ